MIKVGVLGAAGKMGSEVCRAITADPDTELIAAIDPFSPGVTTHGTVIESDISALTRAGTEVAVDFTHPSVVFDNVITCLDHRINVVVGTTGLSEEQIEKIGKVSAENGVNVVVAPNFAIGAVLMMQFAKAAAPHFDRAEIVELHHDQKADAPSGTAIRTAELMGENRGDWPDRGDSVESIDAVRGGFVGGVRIHSVRLPGLVAHQEVILGGEGQTLTIRHDSVDRTSFMPGVLLAVKSVMDRPGLTVGLEELLAL